MKKIYKIIISKELSEKLINNGIDPLKVSKVDTQTTDVEIPPKPPNLHIIELNFQQKEKRKQLSKNEKKKK